MGLDVPQARPVAPSAADGLSETQAQAAHGVREYEAILRSLNLLSQVSVTDCSGRITEVNDNFCRISGFKPDELLGQPHNIVSSGVHTGAFWADLWRIIAAGESWRGEICNRAKNGAHLWGESVITPVLDEDGHVEKYISLRTDVTAAKLAEQKLRVSEVFLESAGRTGAIGAWQLDLDTEVVTWSEQMCCLNDLDPDYRPTLNEGFEFYTPASRSTIELAVREARQSGRGWDLELQKLTAGGRLIWVRNVGHVELDGGRPVRVIGSMQDITARKQMENALVKEQRLMASLLETIPDQIHFKDKEGRFLRVNPGLARNYGMANTAEAVGRSATDYFTTAYALHTAEMEQQIISTGEPVVELQEQCLWKHRPPTWILTTKMPLYDENDQTIGTFGISRDITAQKLTEAKLQHSNERLMTASNSAAIGIWEFDVGTGRLTWDDWMYRIYGVARTGETEPYALWVDSLHPEDRDHCEREVAAALRGEKEFDTEFRIRRPDKEIRYLTGASHTFRAADGTPLRMTGVNMDVSERKIAELELLETSALLNTVLNSAAQVSIIATDTNLTIKVFNAGAERMLGYSSQEMIGQTTPLVIHDPIELRALSTEESGAPKGWAVFVQPALLNKPQRLSYVRKDGERIDVSLIVAAMYSSNGGLLGYVSVAHDITHQKRYEQSLREATHRAEQASRAKSEFLANMSHEIRTPMNAVIGLSYLLGQTSLDGEQAAFLGNINAASKTLLALINDVLDLSKIEAGELIVEHAPFNLPHLLKHLHKMMEVHAAAKGITFTVHSPPDLPVSLLGDAKHLSQILTNLLSNAIRFTAHGAVTLAVSRIPAEVPKVTISFAVQDTGIGITPEAQARLFVPFAQADASITRRFGGTGLGLSIVKSLVRLLGGELQLTSTPDVGSEFKVQMDFVAASPEPLYPPPVGAVQRRTRTLSGVRVLVVDDSDINQDVTKRILELAGAAVSLANNGLQAFQMLELDPYAFDVILMDVQMPVLDGHAATHRIRVELGLVDLPIIALTAGALSSERQRAVAAGMDDFVIKPFDIETLQASILRHVSAADLSAATPFDTDPNPPPDAGSVWPQIDGIDSSTARSRLANDVGLLAVNLERLLNEFSDIANTTAAPAMNAGRMHKLKGNAGLLGATGIQRRAAEAEAAWVAGDFHLAKELTGDLRAQLERLRRSAVPALEALRQKAEEEAEL